MGEAQQPQSGADAADQTKGDAAQADASNPAQADASNPAQADASNPAPADASNRAPADPAGETADDDASHRAPADPAGEETADAGGEAQIWDELPPEVEYPLRPDEIADAAAPGRAEAWRRRTAAGALFTGFALGLREVLEPDRNEPAIVMETSGVPPKDLPVEADIDQVPPRQSVVKIRRWLLPSGADKTSDEAADKRIVADKER